MKLYELIQQFNTEEVAAKIIELYPDQEKNLGGYINAYNELLQTQPTDNNNFIIVVSQHTSLGDWDGDYVDVAGRKVVPDTNREVNGDWYKSDDANEPYVGLYAIEGTPWPVMVNWEIESQLDIEPIAILAHIVWEMTWAGYSNEEVQAWNDNLKLTLSEAMEDIKAAEESGDYSKFKEFKIEDLEENS